MPSGLKRYQRQGYAHFLTFSCYRRFPYLNTAHARDVLEQALEESRQRHGFLISAYVVMPEHVHLLVSEPPGGLLSAAIQGLKITVAKRLRESPFWQPRYYDLNIFSEEKWAEKLFYIHHNPVKRMLVTRAQDWKWSSASTYETLIWGLVRIDSVHNARQDMKLDLDKALRPRNP